jgi:hypothetical protein
MHDGDRRSPCKRLPFPLQDVRPPAGPSSRRTSPKEAARGEASSLPSGGRTSPASPELDETSSLPSELLSERASSRQR